MCHSNIFIIFLSSKCVLKYGRTVRLAEAAAPRLVAQSTSDTSCFIFALTWSTSRRKVPELDDNELEIDVNIGSFDFDFCRKAPG